MPDPIDPIAAAPTTPPAPEVKPAETDPVKSSLLSSLLGLVSPEDKKVTPPEPAKPAAEPVAKPAEPEPKTAPKKIKFTTKPEPKPAEPSVDEVVKRTVAAMQPAPTPTPAATPEDLSHLSEDEREELELAEYAEKKDPSKKGIAAKYKKFFTEQKAFLQKRITEEGEDYDPATDAKFKQFLDKNEPKVSRAEKKKLFADKIADEAEERGARKAEERLSPKLKQLEDETREIRERPKVEARINSFVHEVSQGASDEMVEYFEKNGRDMAKLQEAFPEELAIVQQHVNAARDLATEFLSLRAGLKKFNPEDNKHKFLNTFVTRQGELLIKSGSELKVRDGKQFALASQMKPGMERTHWTFDNDDVLELLKAEAQRDTKIRLEAEKKRVEKIDRAKVLRAGVQPGAVPKPEPTPSPRTPPSPSTLGTLPPVKSAGSLSSLLGL